MIYERDLDEAIAECLGERNPSSSTCIKLASFYALKNQMYPDKQNEDHEMPTYSYASPPQDDLIRIDGIDTDFARLIDGRKQSDVWPLIDELVSTIQILQPRLYDAVIKKLQ